MKGTFDAKRIIGLTENAVAVFVSLCIVVFHIRILMHAGPFWRDEVNGLNVALMPTVKQVWQSIVYYPFPIIHDLILRAWIALGFGGSDFQLRLLAFLIGILLLVVVWIGSRLVDRQNRAPVLLLAIFALNPVAIQNGDWVRPYGLAMIFIILTFGLIWRFTVDDCNRRALLFATAAAVLSVQTVFLNAVLVFAICAGSIFVLVSKKRWDKAAQILLVGLIAALSLAPYVSVLRQAGDWAGVFRMTDSVRDVAAAGVGALTNHNTIVAFFWALIFAIVVAGALFRPSRDYFFRNVADGNERTVFGIVTLVIAAAGTVAFLSVSGWIMDRYFVPCAAVASMGVFILVSAFCRTTVVRLINLAVSIAIVCVLLPSAYVLSATRGTNCDLVAARLTKEANQNDLILVTSFTFGISFSHYYHGLTPWRTVPEVADHSQHRWDLVLQAMRRPDPMRQMLEEIEATLKSGRKIFVVGALPASDSISSRSVEQVPSEESLRSQVGQFLRQHVLSNAQISVTDEPLVINPLEDFPLFIASGWRESPEQTDVVP